MESSFNVLKMNRLIIDPDGDTAHSENTQAQLPHMGQGEEIALFSLLTDEWDGMNIN